MIYIESNSTDPYFNLAMEEYVFNKLDDTKEYFMLWQNKNTIVVGKYQNTAEEVNQDFVDTHGIRVVRRLSGGGAVYHDEGNLNFTFIVPQEKNPDYNFQLFTLPVIRTLEELGVHAEFNGRNDITIDGKKFSGNSQFIQRDRIMHHGCIMLNSDLDKVQGALKVREAKFASKSVKSVRSRVTTINEHLPERIAMDTFKEALKKQVFAHNKVETYTLTAEDYAQIRRLAKEKYETWEWNYGYYSKYNIQREQKFDAGLVDVSMDVENGCIQKIRISGDFFGNGDIRELEQKLIGIPLDEELALRLEEAGLLEFIYGIRAEDLAGLMR